MTKKRRPGRPPGPTAGNESRKWKRERRLYMFDCIGCGRSDAQTVRMGRARGLLCRNCREGTKGIDDNQLKLFGNDSKQYDETERDKAN